MRLAICVMLATVGLAAAVQDGDYRVTIEKGRAARVLELTAANGWLAVAGLFWLHEGGNAAGSDASNPIRLPPGAPARLGTFQLTKGHVRFVAAPGVGVTAQGQPASTFEFDPEKGEKSSIAADDLIMFIIKRGDRLGVRLLDPKTISRSNFKGLRYFPLRTAYRVQGKFVPYSTAKMVPVPNVLGMTVPMESPGYVALQASRPAVSSRAGLRNLQARGPVLHLQGSDQSQRHLPGRPISPHAAAGRRSGDDRLQQRLQPAVRVHRVCHLSAAHQSQPVAGADRSGRASLSLRATALTLAGERS